MLRITRRDFLKHCSVAAGALGLSASTLMKVENVLAKTDNFTVGGQVPDVVWISGSACTGCTMSLLNSVFYTTVDELLFNRIDLEYLDTAMATAGAYSNGVQYPGANALKAAQDVYANGLTWPASGKPFVLCVEGAIPTATPDGGNEGDYCRIGSLTVPYANETVLYNVKQFADNPGCVAVLAIGTCSSFGGIPGARGNVCSAKGLAFTGTRQGGAIVSNEAAGKITSVLLKTKGSGYAGTGTGFATASFTGGTSPASVTVHTGLYVTMNVGGGGTGYAIVPPAYPGDVAPSVSFTGGTFASVPGIPAQAVITIDETVGGGTITAITVTDPGDYTSPPTVVINPGISNGTPYGTGAAATAFIGVTGVTVPMYGTGAGYTSDTVVSFTGGAGTTAQATVSVGGSVKNRTGLAAKIINISGCPPHPDWIVGTIAHILDTYITLPSVNRNYQPVDYGYGEYQCNAGPCPWRYNNSSLRPDENLRYPQGNSRALGHNKYRGTDMGCLGILGCKGRKTKADCSRRRWNADAADNYGVNWCVGSRGGCHGCTEPAFPDKVGKFFTFV